MNQIKLTENEQNKIADLTDEIAKNTASENVKQELYNRLAVFVEGVKIGLIDKTTAAAT